MHNHSQSNGLPAVSHSFASAAVFSGPLRSLRLACFLVMIAAVAALLLPPSARASSILGTAEDFSVLGGSTVTNTGASTVTGNMGVNPGSAITGMETVTLNGTLHQADPVSLQARTDASAAYTGLAAMQYTTDLTGQGLGGLILLSGVYHFDSTALLTGILTLDARGDNNAYWVFQIGSALTTASASSVHIINSGSNLGLNDGLYWQIGSSATLGSATAFAGNILAQTSITMNSGSSIENGRAIALNGAVTMDNNVIGGAGNGYSGGLAYDGSGAIQPSGSSPSPVPEPATIFLLGTGLAGLAAYRKKYGASMK